MTGQALAGRWTGGEHIAAGRLEAPRVDIIADVLPLLGVELETLRDGAVLVLEDYHLTTHPHVHDSLAFFVDHLPRGLETALATRTEPAPPLRGCGPGGSWSRSRPATSRSRSRTQNRCSTTCWSWTWTVPRSLGCTSARRGGRSEGV